MKNVTLPLVVAALVLLRIVVSLTNEFWFPDQDALQIYLIGLKSFTTHTYPFFGADLVYNHSQIPGALQGYLVSAAWYLVKAPESPIIFLDLILSVSLAALAWYASKRLPHLSQIFIWSYLFLLPWSLCYFTRIVNPSYVVVGAIAFFIGWFEATPQLRIGAVSSWLCFLLMGFGVFWTMQLHLSWVLMLPFVAVAFYYLLRAKQIREIATQTVAFVFGCCMSGSLLVPTLLVSGLSPNHNAQAPTTLGLVQINFENAKDFFRDLSMYFAYGCFDVSRFIGGHTSERLQFLSDYWWAAPFIVFVAIVGVLQLIFLLYRLIRTEGDTMLRRVGIVAIFGFAVLYLSGLFSKVQIPAHGAVLLFPLVSLYALHAFAAPMQKRWMQRLCIAVFVSATIMYVAIAIRNYSTISLYINREAIVQALDKDDYTLVGRRRYEPTFDSNAVRKMMRIPITP